MKKIISLLVAILMFCTFLPLSYAEGEPTITFASVDEKGKIATENLKSFKMEVTGAEATAVLLYLDGKRIGESSEQPFTFDISEEVTALGSYNVVAAAKLADDSFLEAEREITVFELEEGKPFEFNFDEYDGVSEINNMTLHAIAGPRTVEDRADNGKCFVWPAGEDEEKDKVSGGYRLSFPETTSSKSEVHYSLDLYMSNGTSCLWYLNSGDMQFAYWQNEKIYVKSGGALKSFDCPGDQWHSFEFLISWADGKISVCLDKEPLLTDAPLDNALAKDPGKTITNVQHNVYKDFNEVVKIDNISLKSYLSTSYMTGIAQDAPTVDYTGESAEIVLTRTLEADETDYRIFKVANEIGEVELSAAESKETDSILSITPKEGFQPSNTYSVLIPAATRLADGKVTSKPIKLLFKTSAKALDVKSAKITDYGEKAVFSAEVTNTTGSPKQVTIYLSVYENGVFKKLVSKPDTIENGETKKISTDAHSISETESYTAFVADDSMVPLSNKIYKYKK